MIDNWTFGRKIAAGFALSLILLVAIGSVAYSNISKLTDNSEWVTHTHEVLEHIAGVLSLLKDAETGSAGTSSRATKHSSIPITQAQPGFWT